MNETLSTRIRRSIAAWIEAAYAESYVGHPLEGVLEASRWGWLPALSGVAVAADSAVEAHSAASGPADGHS